VTSGMAQMSANIETLFIIAGFIVASPAFSRRRSYAAELPQPGRVWKICQTASDVADDSIV
jgi:hypothetical protein